MLKRVASASAAAFVCLWLPTALAGAGPTVKTKVLIDGYEAVGDEVRFSGRVGSPRRACEKRRRVLVIGRDVEAGDATRVLGRDRTGPRGRYLVAEQIPFPEDFARAKVKRVRVSDGKACSGDRSPEISTAG
jgi:hypothetical protein